MGKPKGRHRLARLSAVAVRKMMQPGMYADGGGLYLRVTPTGGKQWMMRVMVRGRTHDIGLGGVHTVALADARAEALRLRRLVREGVDVLAERRKARARIPTFAEAARRVWEANRATWRSKKHAQQWLSTIETYCNPVLGSMQVSEVTSGDVLRVLSPIWTTKASTARRVQQRLSAVFDWAVASGFREGNPLAGITKALPKVKRTVKHQRALPFVEVPGFLGKVRAVHSNAALALEFLTLTACRTSEVLQARWSEFDIDGRTWEIPAERMKANKAHRVPLTDRALEILAEIGPGEAGGYVFQGRRAGKPLSNMALPMLVRRMGVDATVHGFRSSFRDWAAERTRTPREVAEQALAHTIASAVEAAYRRSDLLAKRRRLMEQWSLFCTAQAGKVMKLPMRP